MGQLLTAKIVHDRHHINTRCAGVFAQVFLFSDCNRICYDLVWTERGRPRYETSRFGFAWCRKALRSLSKDRSKSHYKTKMISTWTSHRSMRCNSHRKSSPRNIVYPWWLMDAEAILLYVFDGVLYPLHYQNWINLLCTRGQTIGLSIHYTNLL